MINEYIKIHHQDGLVTFAGRSEAQAIWYIDEGRPLLDVYVENRNQPSCSTDEDLFYIKCAQMEFSQFPFSKTQFENLENEIIEIPDQFEYSEKYNSDIFMYFGFCIAINQNKICFTKQHGDYYIHWHCIGGDISYYDERAKPNKIEVVSKITLIDKTKTNE
jgi:hypothetical protein